MRYDKSCKPKNNESSGKFASLSSTESRHAVVTLTFMRWKICLSEMAMSVSGLSARVIGLT